jgi:oligosaccharide reducing-end xylanase
MKLKGLGILFLVVASIMLEAEAANGGEQGTSDRKGAYYMGVYKDLFVDLLGKNDSEIRSKLDGAFNQLFFGDDKTQRVYYTAGSDMAYIEDIGDADVRTEGMSYGMMIAVQMNKKDVFDRLWKWAKTYMQFRSGPHEGYFAWHCGTDGTVLDSNAASDGEQWFVMSLFFASARWGNGNGIYDYQEQAQDILNTMLHKESEPGHDGVTNMFNGKEHLVVFVPDVQSSEFTDPSYQLPHFYELWARWTDKDKQFWCDAAAASRRLLKNAADSTTGLTPDYCQFDGKDAASWAGGHADFRFDAWRVAMNIATDYEWFDKDEWEVTECNRLLNFFRNQGINEYGNQYTLDGRKLGNDHSKGLVEMNSVAALVSTSGDRKDFVQALWDIPVPHGLYRYYDGMLYMLAMLQVSGNFRIYDPDGKPVPACDK